MNKLIHGDCLEVMKNIPDGSVDMILCDLPYQDVEFLSKKPKMVMTFSLMKHTDRLQLLKNGTLLFQIGEILYTKFNGRL